MRFALLWLALLGASYGFGRNTHLAIVLLPSRVNAERRTVLELAVLVSVGGFAVLVLFVGGLRLVATTLALGQSSAALGIERGYVYSLCPSRGSSSLRTWRSPGSSAFSVAVRADTAWTPET